MKTLKEILDESTPTAVGDVDPSQYSHQWMGNVSKDLAEKVNKLNTLIQQKSPDMVKSLLQGQGAQLIQEIEKEWEWFKEKLSVYKK